MKVRQRLSEFQTVDVSFQISTGFLSARNCSLILLSVTSIRWPLHKVRHRLCSILINYTPIRVLLRAWASQNVKKWETKTKISKYLSESGEGVYLSICVTTFVFDVSFFCDFFRPVSTQEKTARSPIVVETPAGTNKEVQVVEKSSLTKNFAFDRVFGTNSKQVDVYKVVAAPLVEEVLAGYNCTVFAYGQTGTGKTFTMEGERHDDLASSWENVSFSFSSTLFIMS